jgi:hypothetical protein
MRYFVKTSFAFLLGLVVVLLAVDRFLGWRQTRLHGKLCLSPEIYLAIERANEPSRAVRSVFLGDSVAHQLFRPGSETRADERFLTCNQAGSLGAQYYILADAVRSFSNLHDVYLLYYPGSFENDLGPPLANDYFCGFFHTPVQIREVFGIKHDARLTLAQIGRLLLPNILATNGVNRPVAWEEVITRPGVAATPGGGGNEPLVHLLNTLWRAEPTERRPDRTAAGRPVFLSRVSQYYLPKMRELCRSRGVTFHVLPCPCSNALRFDDGRHLYDAPIIYLDAAEFGDQIHLRQPFRAAARRQLIDAYHMVVDAARPETGK